MPFTFEKLSIYQKSLEFVGHIEKLSHNLKRTASYSLLDQLQRAALSIPLNIAEGYGRHHSKDRLHFFHIARGSIFECVPILQVLSARKKISSVEYDARYSDLEILSKMIAGLIKAIDTRS